MRTAVRDFARGRVRITLSGLQAAYLHLRKPLFQHSSVLVVVMCVLTWFETHSFRSRKGFGGRTMICGFILSKPST